MSHQDLLTDFVANHPAFDSLTSSNRAYLLANISLKSFKKDDLVFTSNTPSKTLYFIAKGSVSLTNQNGTRHQPQGTFLGSNAVIGHHPYDTTVTAESDLTLIALPAKFVKKFLKEQPEVLSPFLSTETPVPTEKKETKERKLATKEVIGYASTFLLPIVIFFAMGGTTVNPSITLFTCIMATTICMWFFKLFPNYIPAIFFLLASLTLGLAPPEVLLQGFSTQTFIIMMSTFTIGSAILLSGLGHRLMLRFFTRFSHSYFKSNLALFFTGLFLTPFMPAMMARSRIAVPIYLESAQTLQFKKDSLAATQLALSLFFGITLFSNVFLSGSLLNYMFLGLLPEYMQIQFSWSAWLKATSIYGSILLIGYFLTSLYYGKTQKNVTIKQDILNRQGRITGPASSEEKIVILAVLIFILGILTVSFHKIETAWVAFFVMFFLLFFNVLNTREFNRSVDWTFLIVIATSMGISAVLKYVQMDLFLFEKFSDLMGNYQMDNLVFLGFAALFAFMLRIALPQGPAAVISGTLTIPLAAHYQIHPWAIAFTLLVTFDIWFFKHQSATYGLFKSQFQIDDKLLFDETHFIRFNHIMNFIKIFALIASIPLWEYMGLL